MNHETAKNWFGPPEKFKAIRDFVPCVSATYGPTVSIFRYATDALKDEAYAALNFLGLPTHDRDLVAKGVDGNLNIYVMTHLLKD